MIVCEKIKHYYIIIFNNQKHHAVNTLRPFCLLNRLCPHQVTRHRVFNFSVAYCDDYAISIRFVRFCDISKGFYLVMSVYLISVITSQNQTNEFYRLKIFVF